MIKGRYVALVEVDIHIEEQANLRPFEEMKELLIDGTVTEQLTKEIKDVFIGSDENMADIKVTQQYADLYQVEDEDDND